MVLLPKDGTGISAGGYGRERRPSKEGEGGFGNPGFGNACVLHVPVSRLGGRARRRAGAALCRCPAMERLLPVSGVALRAYGVAAQVPVVGAGATSQGNPAL